MHIMKMRISGSKTFASRTNYTNGAKLMRLQWIFVCHCFVRTCCLPFSGVCLRTAQIHKCKFSYLYTHFLRLLCSNSISYFAYSFSCKWIHKNLLALNECNWIAQIKSSSLACAWSWRNFIIDLLQAQCEWTKLNFDGKLIENVLLPPHLVCFDLPGMHEIWE